MYSGLYRRTCIVEVHTQDGLDVNDNRDVPVRNEAPHPRGVEAYRRPWPILYFHREIKEVVIHDPE